ncbi:MAG TPA: extracellular solute-binding protein [Firmicutes bacterium]|nr:extracellular solute-binding protein [Bacillota bacterium]
MMRKHVGMAMIWLLLIVMMFSATVQGKTIITHLAYVSSGQQHADWLMKKAADFMALYPDIQVDIVVGNHDKMKTMMAAGVDPDIFDLPDFDYLGGLGQLADIRPMLERDRLINAFNPIMMDRLIQPNGAIYKVPLEVAISTAWYNRDIFHQTGLTTPDRLGSNWTWDMMVEVGKKTTLDLNGDGMPDIFGIDRPWGYWRTAVYQAGGKFYEFDENQNPVKSLWNTPEVLRGVQYVESFYRLRITPHHTVSDQTQYYFWTGKTALDITDGLAIINVYLKNSDVDWDFMLQPAGPAGPIAAAAAISGPLIMKSTKDLEATWKWAKFIAMDREQIGDFVKITGRMPALLSAQPFYPEYMGLTKKNFQAVIEQSNYPPPVEYPVSNALAPRLVSLDPVWKGDQPAANFLQALHEKMTNIIKEEQAARATK